MKSDSEWAKHIQEYFECPGYEGLYVLGCFARHVTLYSQQVRAFNLVYGLSRMNRLGDGGRVAVIGAGAAGLAAAAAARHVGCKVTILEEMEGPLELQRNNRQRWIHPRIYDWPAPESELKRAGLPILNWSAGYAEKVALEIQEKWESSLRKRPLDAIYSVEDLEIGQESNMPARYTLSFSGEPGGQKTIYVDHLIVAVGFGLEKRTDHGDSYWAEDDYDAGFRKPNERWLVSGLGDGALTDLMRLCIKRFRHDQIMSLIATSAGMVRLFQDLRDLNADMTLSDAQLSEQFESQIKGKQLAQLLTDQRRKHGPSVYLTGNSSAIYGRGSSILNRVIVALLSELSAFRFTRGPTEKMVKKGKNIIVTLGNPRKNEKFDRVIVRHGPQERIEKFLGKWFPDCRVDALREKWRSLSIYDDESRVQHWKVGAFGPERDLDSSSSATNTQQHAQEITRFGVSIRSLVIHKELRDDGGSRVIYLLEGITVHRSDRSISGVHIFFETTAGKVERPDLGETGERLGLKWISDSFPDLIPDITEDALRKVQSMAGTVRFEKPLVKNDSLDFAIQTTILNGDALTKWEFEHLYRSEHYVHINGEPLDPPQEYFARTVWCPIEQLTLRVTLPPGCGLGTPTASMFRLDDAESIEPPEVFSESIVQLHPSQGSQWRSKTANWKREKSASALSSIRFIAPSPQTWEMSVSMPAVGTCYSLDWTLPVDQPDQHFGSIIESSILIRGQLIEFRDWRIAGMSPISRFTRVFELIQELYQAFTQRQKQIGEEEGYELELMTFNDVSNRLESVSGIITNGESALPDYEFWLPFGLGLAGAAYKQGDRAYAKFADETDNKRSGDADFYLPLRGQVQHSSLIAIPIDNPNWNASFEQSGKLERSRQVIGIINIGARSRSHWFEAIRNMGTGELDSMRKTCQDFGDRIAEALGSVP